MTKSLVWRYFRALAVPALIWCLVVVALREPLQSWLQGEERYDEDAVREWVKEATIRKTLPELAAGYLDLLESYRQQRREAGPLASELALNQALLKREEIGEHLKSLGNPPTKMYGGQLPLFPVIYRLEVAFELPGDLPAPLPEPIFWDSEFPRQPGQYRELRQYAIHPHARLDVQYQLHAYNKQHENEQLARQRLRWLSILAVTATLFSVGWIVSVQHRERERERHRLETQHQIDATERRLLQEELRRREAEGRQEETERQLLEQKSQFYANIGIMAGSYAHNIKNLLVRPNDLLHRCLEGDGMAPGQSEMLHEVQHTLGTVTERLQQILRTVRRDPSRSEMTPLDLTALARDSYQTWTDLAREKWKLTLTLQTPQAPVWIQGDYSHLQQAIENLIFNSRDATFEMRNHLRDQAHRATDLGAPERRQALIAAAAWRGEVILRVLADTDGPVLEVQDNGIGMTEPVRRRCMETHFSTKRDNAVYEGISTGMGLGLSFVVAILAHHAARLEIESAPLKGTTMRVRFPVQDQIGSTGP